MPELPEVELVAKSLSNVVTGAKILNSELRREKLVPETDSESFARIFRDSTIISVHRRGKHILIELSNGKTLIVHLRMSGRFLLLPLEADDPKFSHAVFYLENDKKLIFQDQRHFGFMKIVETKNLWEAKELSKLAPEPFSDEFSLEYLKEVLEKSQKSLKELLLDQTKVCGLGNIYAAEAMFLARLNPTVISHDVSKIKARRLHKYVIEVLRESIEYSSTLNVDPENFEENYYGGGYESVWRVYNREGKACPNCKTRVKRIKQAGRSSYFCPRCQRK